MAQYPDAQPSIPRATDSDYSDDPVVGFPALTDRLADEVEAITSELGTDPSGASATVKARIEAVESGKVSTSDSRLTDARTPTSHASTHGSAGSDPVTVTQSQVTNLTTDLGALDTRLDSIETNANPTYVLVRNATGATLSKGTLVYTSGANGDNVQVSKALATSDATSSRTLGFTTTDIANGADGYVIVEGYLTGVDTSSAAAGAMIYLSDATAGGWTTTAPVAPVHYVQVGVITRSNVNNGSIFVKVQNGYELDEIHNVLLVSKTNGDLLKYDSATDLWKNSPQSTLTISESQVTDLTTDLAGKVGTARAISTTAPLSGGGDLSADRTLSIADASTTQKGAVQLNASTSSTSTTEAATPSAVKSAYDIALGAGSTANAAQTTANAAIPKSTVTAVGDLIIGNGSGAVTNLAKGSSGQVLQASAFGLQWATPSSGGYSTLQDEASALTSRSTVNFTGAGVVAVDNAGSSRTDVSVYGVAPKLASQTLHYPTYGPLTANFGTFQRAYYIPFVGNGNTFNTAYVQVDVANASGVVTLGVYTYVGISLQQVANWGTIAATSTGVKARSITGNWTPTVGVTYYLAVLITGSSSVKLRGSTLIAAVQSNGNTSTNLPPWGAYYGDSLTALPATDYAPYNGLITDVAPVVYLYVA